MRCEGRRPLAILAAILAGLLWGAYSIGPKTWPPSSWREAAWLVLVVLAVLCSVGSWALAITALRRASSFVSTLACRASASLSREYG
jgi:drug/metabolite transporter (DMT)-like permease